MSFLVSLPGPIAQGIIWGIMAIGVYITFRILNIADLSVDGSMATGGAVFAVLAGNGMNVYLALLIAFLAGCLAGLATGIFHVYFGIPAILAGILTQLGLYSLNLRIMGGRSNVTVSDRNINGLLLTSGNIPMAILVGVIFAVVLIAVLYWFFGTQIGQGIRATGCNSAMARANGVNTKLNTIFALVISNGIVALSGALLSQYQGFADINMGRGAIVIGLAAVIIGEVIFGKIFHNFALTLVSIIIGGIIYYIVLSFVIFIGLNANDLKLFSALVVSIFLGVPYWKKQMQTRFSQKSKKKKGDKANA